MTTITFPRVGWLRFALLGAVLCHAMDQHSLMTAAEAVTAPKLESATQALPQAYLPSQDGRQPPDHRMLRFWDILMQNPAGKVIKGCSVKDGNTCVPGSSAPSDCCAQGFCYDFTLPGRCCTKEDDNAQCTSNDECCSGYCSAQQLTCLNGLACFSRDTRVVVQGSAEPVAVRDLRVGQQVLCYEAGADMLAPGAPTWCEVKNFLRADDTSIFPDMVRLTVRAADGTTLATTITGLHLVHIITDHNPRQQAPRPEQLGAFDHKLAINTQVGQLTPLPTSPDLNATFQLGVIESVEVVNATGKMIPAIEHPYLWADGIVQPIWSAWFRPTSGYPADGVTYPVDTSYVNAFRHILHAPLWMTGMQPKGTPGKHAQWAGSTAAPLLEALEVSVRGRGVMPVAGSGNLTRALEWFQPRYEAWKADSRKAITEADVLAAWPSFFDAGGHVIQSCATDSSCGNHVVYDCPAGAVGSGQVAQMSVMHCQVSQSAATR